MITYCFYISRQSTSSLSTFNSRFNEPLEAPIIDEKMLEKVKFQEIEKEESLIRLNDMDSIRKANADPLPTISAFGTDWGQPNWTENICSGDEKKCGAKLKSLETRLRASPKYKTVACIIQKNMSTILQAIMCYLFDEDSFVKAGRIISRECHNNRFCVKKNEFNAVYAATRVLNVTRTEMADWKYVAIVRDPIDRFLSGFVDKCIRKPNDLEYYCNNCGSNMTCFILTEYERIMRSSNTNVLSRTFEDRHFFPQNWRCNFRTELKHYHLIEYSSHPEHTNKFLNDLLEAFKQQHVPDESQKFIRDQLTGGRTVHATVASDPRIFLEKRLLSSPFLMEYIIRMFYWDYRLLGFKLPIFKPIE
uniref:Sulfotransferase n=1 Tax=Panagrolaimus sp. ES5 TaxID=591445 RepID=A0AC34GSH0_9BILA